MKLEKQINEMFTQLQAAILKAAAAENSKNSETSAALLDYTNHHDRLAELLKRELQHERQHRAASGGGSISKISAAKLLICENVARGAELKQMPPATNFITWRDSAAESWLLGYMLREYLDAEWIARAVALDYAKAVRGEQVAI